MSIKLLFDFINLLYIFDNLLFLNYDNIKFEKK